MKIIEKIGLLLLAAIMVSGTSCVSSKKYKDLEAQNESLQQKYERVSTKNQELEANMADMEKAKAKMTTDLANCNRDSERAQKEIMELNNMNEAKQQKLNEIKAEIREVFAVMDDSLLNVTMKGDKLHVSLANSVMYKPGSANLNKSGREVVDQLAGIFKERTDMAIMVEGHTDSDPVRRSRYLFNDNWDLSTARASNVIRRLVKEGVDAQQLTASGRADLESKDDSAMSRRVEFIIQPALGELYNMVKK